MQDIIKALQQIQSDMKMLHGKISAKKYRGVEEEKLPGEELASGGMAQRTLVGEEGEEEGESEEGNEEEMPEEDNNMEEGNEEDEVSGPLGPKGKKPAVKITAIKALLSKPPSRFK